MNSKLISIFLYINIYIPFIISSVKNYVINRAEVRLIFINL